MRIGNLLLVVVCSAATALAASMAWQWRDLAVVATRGPQRRTAGASALDAVRTLACVASAGFVSGILVVGLGGRLVMRILAATSGDLAQHRVTDAGQAVGNISVSGSLSFMIFAGILIPIAAGVLFVPLRRFVPTRSWIAGIAYGVILLGFFGVDDPLAPDNVDFVILSPLWLAVALVSATSLLFGTTFAALVARLDATLPPLSRPLSALSWRHRAAYSSLIFMFIPFMALPAALYLAGRTVFRGRVGRLIETTPVRQVGQVAVAVLTAVALVMVIGAAGDII